MFVARCVPCAAIVLLAISASVSSADPNVWPELPMVDHDVVLPAQEWPRDPGPRKITAYVRYPGGDVSGVNARTGIMLTLHCWGCDKWTATADPAALAQDFNVVGIAVDYLQSGEYDPARAPLPYDFGYFQALDALRALYFVYNGLQTRGIDFDTGRVYAAGGSGGGNVSLMANKLAPRTFAAVVDMCGMAKLNDDIAYGLPNGSRANACYSSDPESPRFLTPDAQLLRFAAYPPHLDAMKQHGNTAKVIIVHGVDDDLIPPEESRELATHMRDAGLNVEAHFLTKEDVDGDAVRSSGHLLGEWGLIIHRFAAQYLAPDRASTARRNGPTDFDRRDESVRYSTDGGAYVISYTSGYPVGRFEPTHPKSKGD